MAGDARVFPDLAVSLRIRHWLQPPEWLDSKRVRLSRRNNFGARRSAALVQAIGRESPIGRQRRAPIEPIGPNRVSRRVNFSRGLRRRAQVVIVRGFELHRAQAVQRTSQPVLVDQTHRGGGGDFALLPGSLGPAAGAMSFTFYSPIVHSIRALILLL